MHSKEEDEIEENSDTDDSDFNPLENDNSGEESIDSEYDGEDYEGNGDDAESKSKKSKATKKRSKRGTRVTEPSPEKEKDVIPKDPEAEKKRIDALFAEFLGSSELPTAQPTTAAAAATSKPESTPSKKTDIPKASEQPKAAESQPKIFEFAGETIEISNSESIEQANKAPPASKPTVAAKRPAGSGLSSMLNQLTKKNKLSVLEKTKLDWDGFKSEQGINEELKSHNRGRDGFLERRDFLERTDLRQFEIEKSLRMSSKRSTK